MPPMPDEPLQSPQDSDSDSTATLPRASRVKSPLNALSRLPFQHSNSSLSNLFASTSSLNTNIHSRAESDSAAGISTGNVTNGSIFLPDGSTARASSPSLSQLSVDARQETRSLITRAFSPHVSILASNDTEELIRHKGVSGGLLELLRPFGERVSGKVTIRDSSGTSKSWDDYSIRFVGVKDGLENPRSSDRHSIDSASSRNDRRTSLLEYKPARQRTGGDVQQIEELVERHLTFAEEQSGPVEDFIVQRDESGIDSRSASPFYHLYLSRLLSGLPLVPSETFSHPVASVIAISSRSASPIEDLRTLYASSNSGEHRLPHWVHNEFLRYYLLIHDEDYDDIQKSMALYDQMKRHFGLHCHLLRLRSTQCVSSDDDVMKLPSCDWAAAGEELAEIVRRETSEDDEDPSPCIFETDAAAIRAFVREMVTQSIVPSMERASATWNDQVASRRRGISGRFISLSKRFTAFGSNRNSSGATIGGASSNYDSLQGFYRPDSPEAIMRKLADYAMMLRDYRLAHGTYEILCQDFKNDKAWKYFAASSEMTAISALLLSSGAGMRVRVDAIDQYLENAHFSYLTRVGGAPYSTLRAVVLCAELLKLRGGDAIEDSATWFSKVLDDRLVGPIGHALIIERIAVCFTERKAHATSDALRERRRKAAFWNTLAADAWMQIEKSSRAGHCLNEAIRLYTSNQRIGVPSIEFSHMSEFLFELQQRVQANRPGPRHLDEVDILLADQESQNIVEPLQDIKDLRPITTRPRRSTSTTSHLSAGANLILPQSQPPSLDLLGTSIYSAAAVPTQRKPSIALEPLGLSPVGTVSQNNKVDDGFE